MDEYTKYARVYPSIVGMIIPFLVTFLFAGEYLYTITNEITRVISYIGVFISSALIYSALGYFLREVFRSISKWIFQFPLFKEDETKMPTTTMLLWSEHQISKDYHQRIIDKVKTDFKINLLSEQEEKNDQREARLLIVNAVQNMRQVTRKDSILLQYNREFGFCRNYLGASTISLLILFAFLILDLFVVKISIWYIIIAICLQILLAAFFFFSLKWRGRAYARQLFASYLNSIN